MYSFVPVGQLGIALVHESVDPGGAVMVPGCDPEVGVVAGRKRRNAIYCLLFSRPYWLYSNTAMNRSSTHLHRSSCMLVPQGTCPLAY
eukprot:COSAG02_NODE_1148_length_14222_cov_8.954825_6_plen_88_part_00